MINVKKLFLILLVIFSLVGLTSCNKTNVNKLDIKGSEADEDDLEELQEAMQEYLEENEFKNKWYSLTLYELVEFDEYTLSNGNDVEDYSCLIEGEGSYYYSNFFYEQKVKISATKTISYKYENGEKYESKTEITYIYIDGKEYCKEEHYQEYNETKRKNVTYYEGSPEDLSSVRSLNLGMYNYVITMFGYDDIYKDDNMFLAQQEVEVYGEDGISQVIFEFDDDNYQLKKFERYTDVNEEDVKYVYYTCIKSKTFGFVMAPKNPEKYVWTENN